jgi:catechol 2,3-dioxygenase-like lactoylglutathione lyase family enzyme
MNDARAAEPTRRVLQLRVVLQVTDFENALEFYRDILGLTQDVVYPAEGEDARVALLEAGRATLELVNRQQAERIDALELGARSAQPPTVRLAFEVADAAGTTDELVAAGARHVAGPTETPWSSLNSRLDGPGDVQLTLFQELGAGEGRPD